MERVTYNGSHQYFNRHPDECPHCHHAINAEHITSVMYNNDKCMDLAYKCPRYDCSRMFIGIYRKVQVNPAELSKHYILQATTPRNPISPQTPEDVVKVSPQFAEIYMQANKAEAFELDAVAGVGYRKALEFLVKDYCATKLPDKAEEVKSRPLGQVIDTYVDNENIKQCAKRAVWLGNDETHYVRTWVNKDIQDLKLLIKLTVGWIEQEILTNKLIEEMQKQ